ncbi:hypothetical protein J6590_012579 [Homalodisca vitripennis]|nr:hypothetical protein J6590_012579 [Homalodisca vitripennis]
MVGWNIEWVFVSFICVVMVRSVLNKNDKKQKFLVRNHSFIKQKALSPTTSMSSARVAFPQGRPATWPLVDSSGVRENQFIEQDNSGMTKTSTTNSTEEFRHSEGEKRDIIGKPTGSRKTKRSYVPDAPKIKCPKGKARDPLGICRTIIYNNSRTT